VRRRRGPGGQAIDVRGVALDVLDRMGLLGAAEAMRTRMKGFSLVDGDGKELWRTEEGTLSGGSFANDDIELLRDDLAALLMGALPPSMEVIYGDHNNAYLGTAKTRVVDQGEVCSTPFFSGSIKDSIILAAENSHLWGAGYAKWPCWRRIRHGVLQFPHVLPGVPRYRAIQEQTLPRRA
jgi:hypothetical protein